MDDAGCLLQHWQRGEKSTAAVLVRARKGTLRDCSHSDTHQFAPDVANVP